MKILLKFKCGYLESPVMSFNASNEKILFETVFYYLLSQKFSVEVFLDASNNNRKTGKG